jgi:exodeoxyribonuclease V
MPAPPSLSPDQEAALVRITSWLSSPTPLSSLTLGGYAGTGKTTLIAALCRAHPKLTIAVLALTGKAVSVLRSKLSEPNVLISTIHSFIYDPILDPNTRAIIGWRKREMAGPDCADPRPVPRVDLIINDEASMTGEKIYADLAAYGVPLLCVGDHGQLPPVGSTFNLMADPEIRLEQIHRQAADNPIIQLATLARTRLSIPKKDWSPTVRVLSLQAGPPPELLKLMYAGTPDTLIITSTNTQRIGMNRRVLNALGRPADLPTPGARLICLRNNYPVGLFNGMQCTLQQVHWKSEHVWNVDILSDSGELINTDMALWSFNQAKPPSPPPRGAARALPFDFGYAVTCHKAQGSEAPRVFVIGQGFGTPDERRRWMYTAMTRAQSELYVLI